MYRFEDRYKEIYLIDERYGKNVDKNVVKLWISNAVWISARIWFGEWRLNKLLNLNLIYKKDHVQSKLTQ